MATYMLYLGMLKMDFKAFHGFLGKKLTGANFLTLPVSPSSQRPMATPR